MIIQRENRGDKMTISPTEKEENEEDKCVVYDDIWLRFRVKLAAIRREYNNAVKEERR
jgi:hypothetical protein